MLFTTVFSSFFLSQVCKKICKPFDLSKAPLFRAKLVKLDNDKINLILDTGSEVNILNEDYYKSHSEHFILVDSVNNPINTVNGAILQKTYIVETVLNDSINIRFNVMDITDIVDNIFYNQQMIANGLLGIDFFYDNNVVIAFKNKKISR